METKNLIKLIKEAVKKQAVSNIPLINYQPPGLPIVINPIMTNLSNIPTGPNNLAPSADKSNS